MKRSSFYNRITESTCGSCIVLIIIFLSLDFISFGNTIQNNFSVPQAKVISIEDENKSEQKENILYVDGTSWRDGDRHFHVTPENDTIVSHANREVAERKRATEKERDVFPERQNDLAPRTESRSGQNNRGVTDLVYDITDPSFGLVPYRHGNDTIPLNQDISIKNSTNRTSQLVAEIAADQTDQINPSTSGWDCDQFSTQDATINKFGVYDINNSTLNSNATLPFDFSYNGQGEVPAYTVSTTTTDGVPHSICGAFVGSANGVEYNDATDFSQYYFWEPQTDVQVLPGDYSMDGDSPVGLNWYGYTYSASWDMWLYGSRNILDFDLNSGTPTLTNAHDDLTQYWTPFDQVSYPSDQTHQYPADTTVATNGEPTNLYNAMVFTHTDTSTESSDPNDCEHYTYTVTRGWEGITGDYNSTNTPAAAYDQLINSEDTELPVRGSDGTWTDNSGLVDIIYDTVSTQGTDPNQCNYYTYTETPTETATDPCGNEATHTGDPVSFSDTEPPVYSNGTWTDNSGVVNVAYDTESTQGTNPNNCDFYNYSETTTETATDPCGNEASYTHDPVYFSDTEGAYVVTPTPFPEGDTLYRTDMSANHEPTEEEWADFADNQATGHLQRNFYDEIVFEDGMNRLWKVEQYADDPCQNDPQDYFEYYVNIPKTVGIEQKVVQDRASVYPNPTAGNVTISYNSAKYQNIKITLYNMNGQKEIESLYPLSPGVNKVQLYLTNQKSGIYILKLENSFESGSIIKLMKKKD